MLSAIGTLTLYRATARVAFARGDDQQWPEALRALIATIDALSNDGGGWSADRRHDGRHDEQQEQRADSDDRADNSAAGQRLAPPRRRAS